MMSGTRDPETGKENVSPMESLSMIVWETEMNK